ncbi:Bug family tripartite tricarboxylate transporter substrate binding protein [Neoroseomonas oryzicola]|uniref:Tripartite tricarboxylate transporter substrate binding protein n=1 Tax=Neoroseomonas oryzicola TaxID=535904 RepID=A0A9X9WFD3_9PROT|nr:tripartite tricarboxylate transporter substrate binding protein [Neoroseomonas oryzicola]MBR0659043.1 tripartite tricarboxylate transporter substrate binding protein [Neoroseomonas oryzicola]NKE16980.1 tripartite tricarboxylate transporter substrate binding protein [Neoroseomonas oryzicola]
MRRLILGLALALAALPARAQPAYPDRPLRMVIPFAPGGAADVVGRIVAQGMSEDLGQPVVVENRGGSGGVIGSQAALQAPADGYTIVLHTLSSGVMNAGLYSNMPFDLRRAFAPVGLVGTVPNIIVVNPRLQAQTLQELIALVRANPGRITYASSGPGTIVHLSGQMLANMIGAPMVHVPYRGSGPALNDLVAGTVDVMVDTLPPYVALVREGRVRALAMATRSRSAALPDVPTAEEGGLPGYETYNWHAIFVATGTPAPIVARLERALRNAIASPTTRGRLVELGVEPRGTGAADLEAFWDDQFRIWIPIIRASGATAN